MELVSLADVRSAQRLIGTATGPSAAVRTPLLPLLSDARQLLSDAGRQLWVKPENLQPTGAFKIRGALHAVAALPPDIRARGVVTYSSGNHARAIAHAARTFGVPATVVVPSTAPAAKVAAARALGAEIVPVQVADREVRAQEIAEGSGAALIPPFDDRAVIAGQGTAGLEIAEDLDVDVVVAPISGGGLISGVAAAVKALRPAAKIIGVEPELAADARAGLLAGHRVPWPVEERTRTSADGLTAEPSELTFAHLSALVDDIVTVSETEIASTVGVLAREARIVAERSGAVSVAACLHRTLPPGRTAAIVSGGNIDAADLATCLDAAD
ncbi:threonine/serine dehydratase [Saccharopolyspora sp. HNM0986]|uniref:threonine ammonia-lyase n=1 Tax=Saccharopolyspora galaxeae TaxID=2781241 RepID=UPI00190C9E42|nr:threonine/serine dehydratase [Saccharopolyspora sp. HNM0986]MBK0865670.1 threonine/serine dehydratase [Saccharopolyspora sp. HNM0986]